MRLLRQLGWLLLIWTASVGALAALALVLRWAMGLAGMSPP